MLVEKWPMIMNEIGGRTGGWWGDAHAVGKKIGITGVMSESIATMEDDAKGVRRRTVC